MREILFRGKSADDGEWVEGWFFGAECTTSIIDHNHYLWPITPETVGEYTGLQDKNDKKIFEGDVVLYKIGPLDLGTRYPVYFSGERGGYFPFARGDGCGCCEDETVWHPEWCEVIGNIHDNPELLEDTNND